MCGIAGIVDVKSDREIDRDALHRMTDALAHRGPDGEGFFIEPGAGFGHRRLAIIDREGGAQPFTTGTRRCVLTYNGEIYNYRDLARDLESVGLALRTRSDTEALAEGWARRGGEFVHQLRGMFAFSFWEPDARRLTLARDRLGEKPLYYAETPDGFLLFASEIGALLASGLIDPDLSPEAVADYFFYGYIPDPKTIYRNIYKLPPAHLLIVEPGARIRLERYWRPVFASGGNLGFNDAAEMLRERLDETVAAQLVSDVPVGAFLSGGVDSAGVISAMHEAGGKLIACTVGFDAESHDERRRASLMAEKFGADHHVYAAGLDAGELIDEVAAAFGEPFADTSALSSYIVSKMARQHVTVALSGDGGDELFAGYRRYPFALGEERLRSLAPLPIRKAVFGPAGALYPKLDWAPRPLRFKTTFQSLALTAAQGYAAAVAINLPARARSLLSKDLQRALGGYNPHDVIEAAMDDANTDDPLSRLLYADLLTWLPGRMLTKVDRASMAHSLEVRPPLLDHRMVEWAGGLPSRFKLYKGARKRLLKAALAPRLGADYVNAPKQGFDLPVDQWLRAEKNNPLDRLEDSAVWRDSGLIDEKAVRRLARAHQSGAANAGQELWSVIMFDAFLRGARP
mgnify:CR=1 FL=1